MNKKNITLPNIVTFSRLLLVIPLFNFLLANDRISAISIFMIFLVLDFIDGRLARRLEQETEFGKNLDYITDVTIGAVIFFTQLFEGRIPVLISSLALLNYFLFGALIIFSFAKKGSFFVPKLKYQQAAVYYIFLFCLILNIYSAFALFFIYLIMALMYFFVFHYFFELKKARLF